MKIILFKITLQTIRHYVPQNTKIREIVIYDIDPAVTQELRKWMQTIFKPNCFQQPQESVVQQRSTYFQNLPTHVCFKTMYLLIRLTNRHIKKQRI